jgi:hypothetical protein
LAASATRYSCSAVSREISPSATSRATCSG